MFALSLAIALISQAPGRPAEPVAPAVVNLVEGQTTILSLVPEGSRVAKGDVVGELDSAPLRDRLANQQINLVQAAANHAAAKKGVEIAEVAARESEAATAQEITATEGEIRIAELDIKIAQQKIDDAKFRQKIGNDRGEIDKATQELARSDAALTRSRAKLKTLKQFTKAKRKIESDAEIGKARSELESAQAIHDIETKREARLKSQIEACRLTAPADGRVMYANPREPRDDGYRIEEGAIVRERQVLVRILPE